MQQVAEWLEKLGLGQYAQRFAENDMSFAVLPDLTDQGPQGEIGGVVRSVGVELLRAIADFPRPKKTLRRLPLAEFQCPPPHRTPPSAAKSL